MVLPTAAPSCRPDLPLTVVLGAGAVRGLAHVGVLLELQAAGFRVHEMIGTSVGALIAGFYGGAGFNLHELSHAGMNLRSSHLLAFAMSRRVAAYARPMCLRRSGFIPDHLDRLGRASFQTLHHGLRGLGIVCFDERSKREVVFHNHRPALPLDVAVRGASAIPGLFRPVNYAVGGDSYELIDAGGHNRLPVEAAFEQPFQPRQVLAVDISKEPGHRQEHLHRVASLRQRYPDVPIDCICVEDTMHGRSVFYPTSYAGRLLEAGRRTTRRYLSGMHESAAAEASRTSR
jgi:predicted acylesterase/phospholipase RssA